MARREAGDHVAIVIPAKNEAGTVGRVVTAARRHWKMVLVVDDGSSDATASLAAGAGARVVRHKASIGYGGALRTGVAEAISSGAELVVFLDADGAHDPDESPGLVEQHRASGADLTIGSRFHAGLGTWFPTEKRDANLLGRLIFNAAHDATVGDVASGFRVLGPKLLRRGITNASFGAAFELLAYAVSAGLTISEAPISVRYDAAEPFCTGRGELSNFLAVCARNATAVLGLGLSAMSQEVEAARSHEVSISQERFHLHYLLEYDGYLIQRQHPWFADGMADEHAIVLTAAA